MLRQVHLRADDFIYPVFVTHGKNVKSEIASMPGQYQLSLDRLEEEMEQVAVRGIPAVMLFGIPEQKDAHGSDAYDGKGIIQEAIRTIKKRFPHLVVIGDVCLCEYTDHGHCGIINKTSSESRENLPGDYLLNDETNALLQRIALAQAEAGADIVAPSGMIDGMVAAIRTALDANHFEHLPIMSYSVKYASAFYGPFRDAADGAPQFGDRESHQMDPANHSQAFLEADLDVHEGADFLMVKPALAYLDVIRDLRHRYPQVPLVAYNVSGEYSMVKAAAQKGWIDEKKIVLESLVGMKRAGADLIISYHAKDVVDWINE